MCVLLVWQLAACAAPVSPLPAASASPSAGSDYWPTDGWRASTPERQGMDSRQLARFFEQVKAQDVRLHGAVIIRHGYIVAEAYAEPFGPDDPHVLHSCTKSVTSALIGIAIDQGLIKGVGEKLVGFFADRALANLDERKQAITLEHLLSMTSGLAWSEIVIPYESPDNSFTQMSSGDDWVQYVLDRPMSDAPGARFEYNTGGSHLLSAVLQKASGMNAAAFAAVNLFKPLGITDVVWPSDSAGISTGGSGIQMRPRDSARIGYLYLRGGVWAGRQIVSSAWISQSVRQHSRPSWGGEGYGYQWWLFDGGVYSAMGYAGQYILVAPEQDVVAVFNSALTPADVGDHLLPSLTMQFILPAATSDRALPDDAGAQAVLAAAITAIEHGDP